VLRSVFRIETMLGFGSWSDFLDHLRELNSVIIELRDFPVHVRT
jgi:hypothetical protein